MQLREGFAVLRSVRPLLGRYDVRKGGHTNGNAVEVLELSSRQQLVVADSTTVLPRDVREDVEVAGISPPGGD